MKEHEFILSVNTGFFVNRFTDPSQWVQQVSNVIKINQVQFTADLINPSLPDNLVSKKLDDTIHELEKYNIEVSSTFTGAFTRLNNLTHPDVNFRNYYQKWFERFIDISAALGSKSIGSHFGILCQPDLDDAKKAKKLTEEAIERWNQLGLYASSKGIKKIFWEPMSISREYGETIDKAMDLNKALNQNTDIPFSMCLDVDHGDLESHDECDIDPYSWLTRCRDSYDMVHLKQSYENKGGHWPFTAEHNKKGKIIPNKVIDSIRLTVPRKIDLVLELSFKERQPADRNALSDVAESVRYWEKALM